MRSAVIEDSPYPLPEGVLLDAQLLSCVQERGDYTKDGKARSFNKWNWTFLIVGGEFDGQELVGGTEPKITNASESSFLPLARPYVESLLGRELELGEEIDTDDLIGLTVKLTVRHMEPRPRKNGDGFWFNVEVNEVFPSFGGGQTVQQLAQGGSNPPY